MKLISVYIIVAMVSAGAEAAAMPQDANFSAKPVLQTGRLSVSVQPGNHDIQRLRQIAREVYANNSSVSIHAQPHQQVTASQIKKYLIAQGVRAENIRIDPVVAPAALRQGTLEISIETITFKYDRCDYHHQDYRYSSEQKPGCAVRHNLQQALVNPARHIS